MDTNDDQERQRQEQAERDFIAVRDQLAERDVATREWQQQTEALTPEQAALIEPIRAELGGLPTACGPSELDEIARDAALHAIEQRTAHGETVTLEGLNAEPYSDERREAIGLPLPEGASLYLVHRLHSAAREEVDAMIGREADTFVQLADAKGAEPFDRPELEAIAAMKAREVDAGLLLREMTRDYPAATNTPPEPGGPGAPDADQQPARVDTVWMEPSAELTEGDIRDMEAAFKQVPAPSNENLPEHVTVAAERSAEPLSPSPETLEMCHFSTDTDTGDRFRMAADTATNTPWGRLERDLGERIAALEEVTGLQDDPAHRAYVVEQKDMGERITATADPRERAELRREKDAHSQDYAADLLEKGQLAVGNEGRYEEAADMKQEAVLRREIAADLRGSEPPEITPPGKDEQAPADIGRDMAEAAQSALGRTAETAAVLEGPTVAEQRGQQPELQDIRSEAGRSDYADLRAATAELGETDDRAKLADHSLNIRPYMEVSPEGTYIASRPQSSFTDRETDYEAGPVRPGMAAAMESLADTRAVAEDTEREVEDTRIAAAAEKDKRIVEDSGHVMGASTPEASTAEASTPKTAMERERERMERAEMAAAEDRENSHDTGRAVIGGGGRGL